MCEEFVALVKQHVSFSMKQFYKVWIRFRMVVQCGSHVVKGFPRCICCYFWVFNFHINIFFCVLLYFSF